MCIDIFGDFYFPMYKKNIQSSFRGFRWGHNNNVFIVIARYDNSWTRLVEVS